jgi:hypothetical protein
VLLRLDRGRLAGSTDDKTRRWMKLLKWSMALVAQSVRLCAWQAPSPLISSASPSGSTLVAAPPRPLSTPRLFDRPWELALSLGVMARKLWHLQLDACLGPTGPLTATSDDVAYDEPISVAEPRPRAARLPDYSERKLMDFSAAAASSAAALAQHCLRWVLDRKSVV